MGMMGVDQYGKSVAYSLPYLVAVLVFMYGGSAGQKAAFFIAFILIIANQSLLIDIMRKEKLKNKYADGYNFAASSLVFTLFTFFVAVYQSLKSSSYSSAAKSQIGKYRENLMNRYGAGRAGVGGAGPIDGGPAAF